MDNNISYPQYRKYINNQSYFKIISATDFEEIKLIGKKATLHRFKAKILPDRNYISDLTFNYKKYWVKCDESEYKQIKDQYKLGKIY